MTLFFGICFVFYFLKLSAGGEFYFTLLYFTLLYFTKCEMADKTS